MSGMAKRLSQKRREELGYNPNRTPELYALTSEGYIIAQDIACQYEYIGMQHTDDGETLRPMAHLNRAFQGLSEIVAVSEVSGRVVSFIFDISNEVFQTWWAERLGDHYERAYDGQPRTPDPARDSD
jgi:hypothetical protein